MPRDAVDHHLVDRGAQHGRVAVVAEERRLALELLEALVRDVVQLPGRHAGLRGGLERVEDVGDDQVRLAKLRDLGGALELDRHGVASSSVLRQLSRTAA